MKTLRVGITGGIGSGKTTVCQIFETLRVPVYYADYWAKWLVAHDPELRIAVTNLLGPNAYGPDGSYNTAYVGSIVFGQPDKLKALNELVHPAVQRHSQEWHLRQAAAGLSYTLQEAALLIESGSYRQLDALIVVTAPEELRIRRVQARDQVDAETVKVRIARQLPESEKIKRADFIIVNDGDHPLIPQVLDVHKKLLEKSQE